MTTTAPLLLHPIDRPSVLSDRAKAQWKQRREAPLMLSDWDRTLMIHYEVDPDELQPQIPFDLDLHRDKAYVSLIAFTLRRLRPHGLPAAVRIVVRGTWTLRPLPAFLAKTYIRGVLLLSAVALRGHARRLAHWQRRRFTQTKERTTP